MYSKKLQRITYRLYSGKLKASIVPHCYIITFTFCTSQSKLKYERLTQKTKLKTNSTYLMHDSPLVSNAMLFVCCPLYDVAGMTEQRICAKQSLTVAGNWSLRFKLIHSALQRASNAYVVACSALPPQVWSVEENACSLFVSLDQSSPYLFPEWEFCNAPFESMQCVCVSVCLCLLKADLLWLGSWL